MFSCVGVAWSALFTESTRDHKRRVKGIKYTQIATLLSVNIVTITEKVSHSLDVGYDLNLSIFYKFSSHNFISD